MADPLKVECPHCGGTLRLKDRSASGKKVRCPKCEETFKVSIPEDDGDEWEDLDEIDDDLEEEERPAKKNKGGTAKKISKKRKSGGNNKAVLLIVLLALLGVVGVGGIGYLIVNMGPGKVVNKIDLTYLAPDTNLVMHMKIGEFLNNPLLADVLNSPAGAQMFAKAAKEQGVEIRDIATITAGMIVDETNGLVPLPPMGAGNRGPMAAPNPGGISSPPGQEKKIPTLTVVRCLKPLDPLLISGSTKASPATHQGKTYYNRAPDPGNQVPTCMYFPESTVMVWGEENDIKGVIERGNSQVRRADLDFVNTDNTLVIAFLPKSPPNPASTLQSPSNQPNVQALERAANKSFRTGSFGVKLSDQLAVEIVANCAESAGAGEMKSAVDTLFADLKKQYEGFKGFLTIMGKGDVVAIADKAISSLTVSQTGNQVVAKLTIPAEIKSLGQSMLSGLPGMTDGAAGTPTTEIPSLGSLGGANTTGDPSGTLPVDPSSIPAGLIPAGTSTTDPTTVPQPNTAP